MPITIYTLYAHNIVSNFAGISGWSEHILMFGVVQGDHCWSNTRWKG